MMIASIGHQRFSFACNALRRKRFGTLEAADVKRLRQLEQENGRLKKMVADRDLELDVFLGRSSAS